MTLPKASPTIRFVALLIAIVGFAFEFHLATQAVRYPEIKFLWVLFITIFIGIVIFTYFFFRYMKSHRV